MSLDLKNMSIKPKEVWELLNLSANKGRTVFLIGIGGCGMSSLAHILLDLGFGVAGSDIETNKYTDQLTKKGALIFNSHSRNNLALTQPFLVCYSSAIRSDNPELIFARENNIPICNRALLLASFVNSRRGICIAGMHGKTTTSALLAYSLYRLGCFPGYSVGGRIPQLGQNGSWGQMHDIADYTQFFVAETDESDGTLTMFSPEDAIVLNIDEEHLDYYHSLNEIRLAFMSFAQNVRNTLFFCADNCLVYDLYRDLKNAVSWGFSDLADYVIKLSGSGGRHCSINGQTGSIGFEVLYHGKSLGNFKSRLIGEKNVSNITGVIAFLHRQGFPTDKIKDAIENFRGVERRQQLLYQDAQVRVLEDYGHHPCEIEATIHAIRQSWKGRLLVAFQPHRYSRTHFLFEKFADCFREVDMLLLTDIYAASEDPIPGVSSEKLADFINRRGIKVDYIPQVNDLSGTLLRYIQNNDLVLFLGAGNISREAHRFVQLLGDKVKTKAGCGFANRSKKESLIELLKWKLSSLSIVHENEYLKNHTTIRIGGPAALWVAPCNEQDLVETLKFCDNEKIDWFLIGNGSNLLVADGGFDGLVIKLSSSYFSQIRVDDDRMRCGAGTSLKRVLSQACAHGLSGLEFVAGIPGTVGGAIRMNAGAMGCDICQRLDTVRFMESNGKVYTIKAKDLKPEYRDCSFFRGKIILEAEFIFERLEPDQIKSKVQEFIRKRLASQPKEPSAGCVFKNPKTIPAGRLIEQLGFKGVKVGGAKVSEIHANFIVNSGNALAGDVLELMRRIMSKAKIEHGIELKPEIELLGVDSCEVICV